MKEEQVKEILSIQDDMVKDLNSRLEVFRYTLSNRAASSYLKILAIQNIKQDLDISLQKIIQIQNELNDLDPISLDDGVKILSPYLSQYSSSEEDVWKVDGVSKGECGTTTCLISFSGRQILVPIETLAKVR